MIKKETIIAMATALKLDVAAVTAAYDAKTETDVTFDPASVIVLTPAEQASREETLKTRHEQAGMEIAIKNLKADAGVEFEGKDSKKLLEAVKAKALKDANVEESAKVKELNTTIEGLRANIETFNQEKATLQAQAKQSADDQELLTLTIDQKPDHFSNTQWLTLIKLDNKLVEKDGVKVIERNGQIVANKTDLKPLPVKEALAQYITDSKIGKVAGDQPPNPGRGAGDSKTSYLGISNMKQFNDHLKEQNISPNGAQAQQMLSEITAANANFDFSTKAEPAGV